MLLTSCQQQWLWNRITELPLIISNQKLVFQFLTQHYYIQKLPLNLHQLNKLNVCIQGV
jgi:hypothetical protein